MEVKHFSEETKNIMNVSNSKTDISTLFKVKASKTHGRYAFVGWFSKTGISDLTTEGETILNNTLRWLKYGNTDPVFTPDGEIAFVCYKDSCNKKTETNLIKWFRENGYRVTGKSTWSASELQNFDLIACSDRRTCSFGTSSDIYSAFQNGKGFLEIPDGSDVKAGYTFGYSTYRCSKQTTDTVNLTVDPITTGLDNPLKIFDKRRSLCGVREESMTNAKGISWYKDYNNIFISTDGKKYAFAGWASYVNELNEEGKLLLIRTIRWVQCGNPDGC
jgi:hypothetical protein